VSEAERSAAAVKLYVAMIADRHSDTEPYVFSTPEAAIDYARAAATEYASMPSDVREEAGRGMALPRQIFV
jgi:hypothetical protein